MKRQTVKDMAAVTVEPDIRFTTTPLWVTVSVKGDPVDSIGCLREDLFKEGRSVYKVLAQLEEEVLESFFEHRSLPVMALIPLSPHSEKEAIFELQEVIEGKSNDEYTIVYLFNGVVC